MRIGAITVWDNVDEDGDYAALSAAGFSQEVLILHKTKTFFVSYLRAQRPHRRRARRRRRQHAGRQHGIRPPAAAAAFRRSSRGDRAGMMTIPPAAFLSALIAKGLLRRPGQMPLSGLLKRAIRVAYASVVCASVVRNMGLASRAVGAAGPDPGRPADHRDGPGRRRCALARLPSGIDPSPDVSRLAATLWREGRQQLSTEADDLVVSERTRAISTAVFAVLVSLPVLFFIGSLILISIAVNGLCLVAYAFPAGASRSPGPSRSARRRAPR